MASPAAIGSPTDHTTLLPGAGASPLPLPVAQPVGAKPAPSSAVAPEAQRDWKKITSYIITILPIVGAYIAHKNELRMNLEWKAINPSDKDQFDKARIEMIDKKNLVKKHAIVSDLVGAVVSAILFGTSVIGAVGVAIFVAMAVKGAYDIRQNSVNKATISQGQNAVVDKLY